MNFRSRQIKMGNPNTHKGSWDAGEIHNFINSSKRKGDLVNIDIKKVRKQRRYFVISYLIVQFIDVKIANLVLQKYNSV